MPTFNSGTAEDENAVNSGKDNGDDPINSEKDPVAFSDDLAEQPSAAGAVLAVKALPVKRRRGKVSPA